MTEVDETLSLNKVGRVRWDLKGVFLRVESILNKEKGEESLRLVGRREGMELARFLLVRKPLPH